MKKNLTKMCFVLMFFVLLFDCDITTFAKNKVTNSRIKKQVKSLVDETIDFAAYQESYNMNRYQTKKYNFSKSSNRRKFLPYYRATEENANMKRGSRWLFGKETSTKGLKHKVGQWGVEIPSYSLKSIYKIKGNKYSATYDLKWNDSSSASIYKVAKVTFSLKKSSKAPYGFYITKMKIYKY